MKLPKYSINWFYVALTATFAVSIVLRLWNIDRPVADWHSWRQSDTAAVARNFIKFGLDPLRPRFDDLSNIPSGLDNPMGWRMVEFPLYQLISAGFFSLTRVAPIEVWLRLVTIFTSSFTAVILGLIFAKLDNPIVGILAAVMYAVLPYSVYYGRTILPDPFMVFWAVLAVYLLIASDSRRFVFLSALCAGVALLVKPFAVFLLFPIPYLLMKKFSVIRVLLYSLISLLPIILWRRWIAQFPEGIAAYTWLLNSNNIRFKGAWFHWLFAKRIGELILGYWGLIPLGFGLVTKDWIARLWLLGALLYLAIVATGNVQHDYYQILLLPVIAVYVAKGFASLLKLSYLLSFISFAFMLAFSWFTIRTYYWINHPEIVEAGRVADRILPKDAKVIASYNGDTTFLYQTNRQGWPIGFDIDKKIAMGATHYVTISPTDNDLETKDLASRYTVIVRNGTYAIIDLTKPK